MFIVILSKTVITLQTICFLKLGLTESILAAAASRIGKTVLHIDPNDYYGGSWASFNLENIQALVNSSQLNTTTNSNVNETSAGIVQINGSNNSSIIKNATNEWASITVTTAPTKEEHMPLTENVDNKFELRDCVTENVDEFIWTKEKVLGEFRKFNIDITPKVCPKKNSNFISSRSTKCN